MHLKAPCQQRIVMLFLLFLAQIYAHYEGKKNSQHRRNLAITGGVALSIITAPVIAAVSVGKFSEKSNGMEK